MAGKKITQPAPNPQPENNITITREEYNKLSELVFSIDGLYHLLESHNAQIDSEYIASVLRPIGKEMTQLHEALDRRIEEGGAQ